MHPQIPGLTGWKPLARGGFAVVWQARQQALDRPVAVKVYPRELDDGDRRRLMQEAAVAGRLSGQPGVVTVHDAGTTPDGRHYLIMELYPGGSLTQWLKPENRPGEEQVREVGIRLADALAAAHAGGVLHGDIKPANILIDSYGNPALADFGLAAETGSATATSDALRLTPAYAPPEVFRLQPPTASGDVFSLAATLYALLAGRPPREVGDAPLALEQMLEVASRPVEPLAEVNWYLMDALLTALSTDPAERPTAAGLRDQLAGVPAPRASGRGPLVSAGHDGYSGGPPKRPGRRGVLVLAAVCLAVVGSATAWLVSDPASSQAPAALPQSGVSAVRSPGTGTPPAVEPAPTPTGGTDDSRRSAVTAAQAIRLRGPSDSARPFETVRIQGTYPGGAATFVRVQRWEGGRWVAFPIPSKTDSSGQFTAFVELGQPGRYRLRVLDVASGVKSEPFVLVIKG